MKRVVKIEQPPSGHYDGCQCATRAAPRDAPWNVLAVKLFEGNADTIEREAWCYEHHIVEMTARTEVKITGLIERCSLLRVCILEDIPEGWTEDHSCISQDQRRLLYLLSSEEELPKPKRARMEEASLVLAESRQDPESLQDTDEDVVVVCFEDRRASLVLWWANGGSDEQIATSVRSILAQAHPPALSVIGARSEWLGLLDLTGVARLHVGVEEMGPNGVISAIGPSGVNDLKILEISDERSSFRAWPATMLEHPELYPADAPPRNVGDLSLLGGATVLVVWRAEVETSWRDLVALPLLDRVEFIESAILYPLPRAMLYRLVTLEDVEFEGEPTRGEDQSSLRRQVRERVAELPRQSLDRREGLIGRPETSWQLLGSTAGWRWKARGPPTLLQMCLVACQDLFDLADISKMVEFGLRDAVGELPWVASCYHCGRLGNVLALGRDNLRVREVASTWEGPLEVSLDHEEHMLRYHECASCVAAATRPSFRPNMDCVVDGQTDYRIYVW
jgi:hypothetical protein